MAGHQGASSDRERCHFGDIPSISNELLDGTFPIPPLQNFTKILRPHPQINDTPLLTVITFLSLFLLGPRGIFFFSLPLLFSLFCFESLLFLGIHDLGLLPLVLR